MKITVLIDANHHPVYDVEDGQPVNVWVGEGLGIEGRKTYRRTLRPERESAAAMQKRIFDDVEEMKDKKVCCGRRAGDAICKTFVVLCHRLNSSRLLRHSPHEAAETANRPPHIRRPMQHQPASAPNALSACLASRRPSQQSRWRSRRDRSGRAPVHRSSSTQPQLRRSCRKRRCASLRSAEAQCPRLHLPRTSGLPGRDGSAACSSRGQPPLSTPQRQWTSSASRVSGSSSSSRGPTSSPLPMRPPLRLYQSPQTEPRSEPPVTRAAQAEGRGALGPTMQQRLAAVAPRGRIQRKEWLSEEQKRQLRTAVQRLRREQDKRLQQACAVHILHAQISNNVRISTPK